MGSSVCLWNEGLRAVHNAAMDAENQERLFEDAVSRLFLALSRDSAKRTGVTPSVNSEQLLITALGDILGIQAFNAYHLNEGSTEVRLEVYLGARVSWYSIYNQASSV